MLNNNKHLDIKEMSFEEALKELENTINKLEEGAIPLEKAISFYERGIFLKKHCEEKLQKAKTKIDQITINENGDINIKSSSLQEVVKSE